MTPCKLRITELHSDEESLINLCKKYSNPETLIVVKEFQPYIHYHLYLDIHVSKPTWLDRLQKIVGKGNRAYSNSYTHHNWDVYKGYLYKHEDTEIIYQHQNDVHNIPHYIKEYETYSKNGSRHRFKDRKYTEISDYIIEKLDDKEAKRTDKRSVIKEVVQFYCDNGIPVKLQHIQSLVWLVYYKRNPGSTWLIEHLYDSIFPTKPDDSTFTPTRRAFYNED